MDKKDKLLFTPGPLTTSNMVKAASLHDLGSRDISFIDLVKEVRTELLHLAGVSKTDGYESVIIQGSGTFGIESVLSSALGEDDHLLLLINGAYGERMARIAAIHELRTTNVLFEEDEVPDVNQVEELLQRDDSITHVAMVHCETTTGIVNPVKRFGDLCRAYNKVFIVDAMSSFGAIPVDMKDMDIDFLISSSNKCIEGIPGFSYVIVNRLELEKAEGMARTLTLDLFDQWRGLEKNGQFRFTPPVQSILSFHQALAELKVEGGVSALADRYKRNYEILMKGMQELGFEAYLPAERRGYIITSFLYPDHENFKFEQFYQKLNHRGLVIYPGKLSEVDCFRIGTIGKLEEEHIKQLLEGIKEVLLEMEVSLQPRVAN